MGNRLSGRITAGEPSHHRCWQSPADGSFVLGARDGRYCVQVHTTDGRDLDVFVGATREEAESTMARLRQVLELQTDGKRYLSLPLCPHQTVCGLCGD